MYQKFGDINVYGNICYVPTGCILYHEGQNVCCNAEKICNYSNDRDDDVNYMFPVKKVQIDFNFMKQITNKVLE